VIWAEDTHFESEAEPPRIEEHPPTHEAATVAEDGSTQLVAELVRQIETLELLREGMTVDSSRRRFWDLAKAINQALAAAAEIEPVDRTSLERRVNAVCHGARRKQHDLRLRAETCTQELESSFGLIEATLAEAATLAEWQQVRADLVVSRERMDAFATSIGRIGRRAIWNRWQSANQTAWKGLNDLWERNAAELAGLLAEAEAEIEAGKPGRARDQIKAFQSAFVERSCSRAKLREMQARATQLWSQAGDLSRQKHERYLQQLSVRLAGWRSALRRHLREHDQLDREVVEVERNSAAAATDVAAALLRGQAEERRRERDRLATRIADLRQRIEEGERALKDV
jgi:hypothetical protein